MSKINFMNDYNQVAHPEVLKAVNAATDARYIGYGLDEESIAAEELIKHVAGASDADVYLFVGGTQTNMTFISSTLKPYEAVIAPATGHIGVHETGAIESTGHKVITVPSCNAKARPDDIRKAVIEHVDEHMVLPRMLYISQATESGTIYSKQELSDLRTVCDEFGLYLYVDGARLAYALMSEECDHDITFYKDISDAFYIGGTKNGLMFGEALLINNPQLKDENFRFNIKQRGGMLAKGFLLGIQFNALLKDELYFKLAKHANEMAEELRNGLASMGFKFEIESRTNQIFPVVTNDTAKKLAEKILFEEWHRIDDDHVSIRFVTTWATTPDDIKQFFEAVSSV